MSGVRRAYLDATPGERRGVMTLDGRPERLLIERDGDPPAGRLGARVAARVRAVQPALRLAFLDLGDGVEATAPLTSALTEGAAIEVEVTAEPRRGKAAAVRVHRPGTGEAPRLIAPAPTLETELAAWAPGAAITGDAAREAAELAEDQALAIVHPLPGAGDISIEPTRALVAIDVDLGAATGDPRRAAARTNRMAIVEIARLLRLKGLGGLVVIDLIGGAQDAEPLLAAARAAFAPEGAGVAYGPLSRFGALQLVRPWTLAPVAERLLDPEGRRSTRTRASDAVRALERAGRDDPGGLFEAVLDIDTAALAIPFVTVLGPRFSIRVDVAAAPGRPDIRRR